MTRQEKVQQAGDWLKKIVWLGNNISYDGFTALLGKMIGGYVSEDYVAENWDAMRRNLSAWLMSLDTDTRGMFIEAAFEKYGE